MWKNPVQATPSIIQVDFGVYGQNLPGDGEMYCAPTSVVMGLYYLYANGFSQLAPAPYGGQEDPLATNLERVIAGLMGTTAMGGTDGYGFTNGVATYLSACGISPDQYVVTVAPPPDFATIANAIAPNVSTSPNGPIVLGTFGVSWYHRSSGTSTDFTADGGHVLAPLVADSGNMLVLNNAAPASFEDVPNLPSENPQTVQIADVPADWNLSGVTQVVTSTLGGDSENVAIVSGVTTWTIDAAALPTAPGYQVSPWVLADQVLLDTNGALLKVIAPIEGAGGLAKAGDGTVVLGATNSSTGANAVSGGTLTSSQTSGTPFGSGAMTLSGGGVLAVQGAQPGSAAIASGSGATVTAGTGGGMLSIAGSAACTVTIGGCDDGVTLNLNCEVGATLVLAPGAGMAALGTTQQILVNGTGGNLPFVDGGMVVPCFVGQDNDAGASGRFLTYDTTSGFGAAATTPSTAVNINKAAVGAIYRVVNEQAIASGGAPQVYALEVDGVPIYGGPTTTLLVGRQADGNSTGVILNDVPNILAGQLQFGGAAALIYTSGQSKISSLVCGTAGLTTFGPGALTLWANNAATLSGPVAINAGTLIAAGSNQGGASATGSGPVTVNAGAMLEVTGGVAGDVTVDPTGVLLMSGGTVSGTVTISASSSPDPDGMLQGGGTITGSAMLDGAIQSGPQAGILSFTGGVSTTSETTFWWRLQRPVDANSGGKPGVDWNALHVGGAGGWFGTLDTPVTYYLDFSALSCGDPDQGDPFWQSQHLWPIVMLSHAYSYPTPGNFYYQSGNFALELNGSTVCLIWTPASSPQGPAQQRKARAAARAARIGLGPAT